MEYLFYILLGLLAAAWVLVGPFLFFGQSSRITRLNEELQKLRKELSKKGETQTSRIQALSDRLDRVSEQHRATSAPTPSQARPAAEPLPASELEPLPPSVTAPVRPTRLPGRLATPIQLAASEVTPAPEITPAIPLEAVQPDAVLEPDAWLEDAEPASQRASESPAQTTSVLRDQLAHRRSSSVNVMRDKSTAPEPAKASVFSEMDASKWMSWVGAVAVMVGVGFGLKYAIDEHWLGPVGRVALGILGGMLTFVGAAYGMKKGYRVLAEGLAGAALGMLYFSLFAAFQWYHLLPQLVAFGGMIFVTAAGLSFAGKFNSLTTAVLAMIGGFLTPLMLSTGGGDLSTLFTYILILDLGVLVLATFRSWGSLHLLNFGGTLLIWLVWLAGRYRPEELWLTVGWITVFAVVFSLMGLWRHVIRRETSSTPDMALMLLTPLVYFAALYALTRAGYSNFHGLMALLVALYYLGLGCFAFVRNPGNNQIVVTLVGVGLSFVTLAVPLQLTGHWIVIAWAMESLLLIEIGLRYEKPGFRLTGFGLLALVQLHMVMYAGGTLTGPNEFTTGFVRRMWEEPVSVEAGRSAAGGIINGRSMSFLANAIVLAILAWEYRRREKSARLEGDSETWKTLGIGGQMPDAGQVSMILIPLVPVIVLVMGLLETFVFGVRAHWSIATHLSMLPIWLSFFAVGTLLSFKRMNDVSTLGALAKCLYGITGCMFLCFFLMPFPDWSGGSHSLWGQTLFNPRGVGFLSALGAVIVGAIQFSRSQAEETENRSIGSSLTLAVPLVLLGMCLTETFAFGQRHEWLWATQLSLGGIWLAVFSVGTLIASRWLREVTKLATLSKLFYIITAGLMLLLLATTGGDAVLHGPTVKAAAWVRPLLNPRGMCLLIGTISMAIGVLGRTTESRSRDPLFSMAQVLAVPITLLGLCLIETFAFGQRHDWMWASHWSSGGIWLSIFVGGLTLAARRWASERVALRALSQTLTVGACGIVQLLFFGTLVDWGHAIRAGLSSAWDIPFLNPRGVCYLLAALSTLISCRSAPVDADATSPPRQIPLMSGTLLGLAAYAITFLMFTIEVYALGKQRDWGTATSLAVTGTWTLLAIATIGAGLVKRSAPLRILALGVFALTTAKVFLYDVWYLDKPIRVAAFVGLGVALFVSSFLYQRFSNRLKDWIKPMSLLLAAMLTLGCGTALRAGDEPDLATRFSHRFEVARAAPA